MSKDVLELIKEFHAFYEVLPYNIVLTEKRASLPAMNRTIQAGFDVDIYGLNPKRNWRRRDPIRNTISATWNCRKLRRRFRINIPRSSAHSRFSLSHRSSFWVAQVTMRYKGCCESEFRIIGASIDLPTSQNNRHLRNLKPSCGAWASCVDDASTNEGGGP